MSGTSEAPRVLVVAGPTATGKTRLGIELARRWGGEIVSADSMQIYRGMDIGTAKATPEERAAAPHHMLDVADPREDYSVSRYVEDAARCCGEILARGRLPILVGGTGLYIDSLLSGRDFAQRGDGDDGLRAALNAEYDRLGGEAMLAQLAAFDPERAEKLHPADRRRIVRAIEIYRLTGRTITAHDAETRARPPRYRASTVVLSYRDRADLYARIDARVDAMIEAGLFEETQRLLAQGLSAASTAMQAIGYKEAVLALRGEISREEAAALIKQNSRRYAKRQLTWFRRDADALWILWDREPDFALAVRQVEDRFGPF
ncbi:MAG: tRNA (adenosine(37)-N6)-dimethylallyltransferase MiaA [Oscillospiraceae bacterium]|nr:tRNA (adenosine(37)-N6)-dimethylallyltransferase MiaA [Oscillospiraceae bacterium]